MRSLSLSELLPGMNRPLSAAQAQMSDSREHASHCPQLLSFFMLFSSYNFRRLQSSLLIKSVLSLSVSNRGYFVAGEERTRKKEDEYRKQWQNFIKYDSAQGE